MVRLTEQERDAVKKALVEFVIRASKSGATPAEVAALAEVAKMLI